MKKQSHYQTLRFNNIKVHGKNFSVTPFKDDLSKGEACGFTNVKLNVIQFDPNTGVDALKETLLHELIHVVDFDAQLEMTERQVHACAAGIYSILKDNPLFAKWVIS